MDRYGDDYMRGRPNRFGYRQSEMGYDSGYRGTNRWDEWGTTGRARGWNEPGHRSWGEGPGARNFNDTWGATGHGRGRPDYGESSYGTTGWSSTPSGYRDYPGRSTGGYGGTRRSFYDREMGSYRGRAGQDYDEDFGDRIRRGWNRLREEARDFMGRGYDRGW